MRLQIYQEVSSVQDQTNPAGIITNKRSIESMVLVDDGQIMVIGGLIQDGTSATTSRRCRCSATCRWSGRCSATTRASRQDQPDGVPAADDHAREHFLRRRNVGALRDMLSEQERAAIPPRPVLPDIPAPRLPPQVSSSAMELPRSAIELARDTPVRLVPYAFARLNGALLLEVTEKEALVCLRRARGRRCSPSCAARSACRCGWPRSKRRRLSSGASRRPTPKRASRRPTSPAPSSRTWTCRACCRRCRRSRICSKPTTTRRSSA